MTIIDARTGKQIREIGGLPESHKCVRFLPDGATIASATDVLIRIWDACTGKQPHELRGSARGGLVFSPNGATLASCYGNSVRIWDARTGKVLRQLDGHISEINSVAFSPDGATIASGSGHLASGSEDTTVRIWDVGTV